MKPGIAEEEFSCFISDTRWIWKMINNNDQVFQQFYLTIVFLLNRIHRIHRNLLTKDSMDSRCGEAETPCIGDF
ncbi:hypothetical protein BvCmsNSNP027_04797 [Escherichia coli]|nr:hypothetical protein BvCmsHHP001_00017 [Escherichia coli]GDO06506.1 hypothetical protein BvCmsNSNP027_04797 [Escherichia coli]